MVSLLDLPAEIRNQIWDLCLVSPTGIIQPVHRRDAYYLGYQGSFSLSGPFFYLVVDETNPLPGNPRTNDDDNKPRTISLSLPRTCRQTYIETNELFWKNNIFLFWSPYSLRRAFHGIGRFPFARITSIRLYLHPQLGNELEIFDETLRLLIKQARRSSLRQLELRIELDSINHMARMKRDPAWDLFTRSLLGESSFLDKRFLPSLTQAHHLHNVEKVLMITGDHRNPATVESIHGYSVSKELDKALRGMQEAWGGRFQWGLMVVWDVKEVITPTSIPFSEYGDSQDFDMVCLEETE